jgi:hypothetical protein
MSDTLIVVEQEPKVIETGEDEVRIEVDSSDLTLLAESTAVELKAEPSGIVLLSEDSPITLVVSERGDPGPRGLQGIRGVPGAAGSAPQSYEHTQASAASTWLITHNLGYRPNVAVVDSGESLIEGDVTYLSVNQVSVEFAFPFSGNAYLS